MLLSVYAWNWWILHYKCFLVRLFIIIVFLFFLLRPPVLRYLLYLKIASKTTQKLVPIYCAGVDWTFPQNPSSNCLNRAILDRANHISIAEAPNAMGSSLNYSYRRIAACCDLVSIIGYEVSIRASAWNFISWWAHHNSDTSLHKTDLAIRYKKNDFSSCSTLNYDIYRVITVTTANQHKNITVSHIFHMNTYTAINYFNRKEGAVVLGVDSVWHLVQLSRVMKNPI